MEKLLRNLFEFEITKGLSSIERLFNTYTQSHSQSLLNQALIEAHSLKGACLFAGEKELTILFHDLESAIDTCSEQKILTHLHEIKVGFVSSFSKNLDEKELSTKRLMELSASFAPGVSIKMDLEDYDLKVKHFLILRSSIRELIKNSYAHSGKENSNLEIEIKGKLYENKYRIDYKDNGFLENPELLFKEKKSSKAIDLISGRGIGLLGAKTELRSIEGDISFSGTRERPQFRIEVLVL